MGLCAVYNDVDTRVACKRPINLRKIWKRARKVSALIMALSGILIILATFLPWAYSKDGWGFNGFSLARVNFFAHNAIGEALELRSLMSIVIGLVILLSSLRVLGSKKGSGKWGFWSALVGIFLFVSMSMLIRNSILFEYPALGIPLMICGGVLALISSSYCWFISRKLRRCRLKLYNKNNISLRCSDN
jgi:4-amino-4-deoxy-L-arabinose transferase-like glycosyltransferase